MLSEANGSIIADRISGCLVLRDESWQRIAEKIFTHKSRRECVGSEAT
jgi:hypothetical protein